MRMNYDLMGGGHDHQLTGPGVAADRMEGGRDPLSQGPGAADGRGGGHDPPSQGPGTADRMDRANLGQSR